MTTQRDGVAGTLFTHSAAPRAFSQKGNACLEYHAGELNRDIVSFLWFDVEEEYDISLKTGPPTSYIYNIELH